MMTEGHEDQGFSELAGDAPPSGDPEKCEHCDYFMVCRIRLNEDAVDTDTCEDRPVQRRRIDKGQELFEAGKPFDGLYVVTDGAFKSTVRTASGSDEVVGFHFPGEYIGLEAFGNGFYSATVQALETSWYCGLDVSGIKRIGTALVDLQSEIIRNLSLDSRHFQWRCQHLLRATVDERIASTLLDFARRLGNGRSLKRFRLPMSRRDIANYLGMAPETLYRTLRKLADRNLLKLDNRTIEILDFAGLAAFAGQSEELQSAPEKDPAFQERIREAAVLE